MSYILNIETSTSVCSTALCHDGNVIFANKSTEGPSHSVLLGTFVAEALEFIDKNGLKLDAVGVSSGPGSYTGLRIGVSMAKGLCFGYGIPLIAVPTLKIIASKAISLNNKTDETLYCAMLDARRMEVYASIFDKELMTCRETAADIVTAETYEDFLNKGPVCFFGNGAEKCKTVITHPNAMFMDQIYPLAEDMALLAEDAFIKGEFKDVAYFEPFYLKDFVATVARNKVL